MQKRSILADGKDIFKEHSIAYVPQENPLVEELSVKDNLLLWYKGDRKKMEKDLVDGPAAFCNGLFRLSGSFPGGVLLLFLVITVNHLAAGGFLPKVFLPKGIQVFSPWMPSSVWMEAFKGIVTENVEGKVIGQLLILFAVGFTVSWLKKVQEK